MTAIRRALAVLALSIVAALVSTSSASATFAKTVQLQNLSTSAITVTAPRVTPAGSCTTTQSSYWNGYQTVYTTNYWYDASVTWSASTTPSTGTGRVTGYRVMVHLDTGQSIALGETTADVRHMSQRVERAYLNYQPRLSVVTLTSYGWTAESPRSVVLTC